MINASATFTDISNFLTASAADPRLPSSIYLQNKAAIIYVVGCYTEDGHSQCSFLVTRLYSPQGLGSIVTVLVDVQLDKDTELSAKQCSKIKCDLLFKEEDLRRLYS